MSKISLGTKDFAQEVLDMMAKRGGLTVCSLKTCKITLRFPTIFTQKTKQRCCKNMYLFNLFWPLLGYD